MSRNNEVTGGRQMIVDDIVETTFDYCKEKDLMGRERDLAIELSMRIMAKAEKIVEATVSHEDGVAIWCVNGSVVYSLDTWFLTDGWLVVDPHVGFVTFSATEPTMIDDNLWSFDGKSFSVGYLELYGDWCKHLKLKFKAGSV